MDQLNKKRKLLLDYINDTYKTISDYISQFTVLQISSMSFSFALLFWAILSYMNIIYNNLESFNYAKWNLFVLLDYIF